jgi:hypothetical protein
MSERGYTITRNLEAPREVVWQAWTTPVLADGTETFWHGVFVEVDGSSRLVIAGPAQGAPRHVLKRPCR